MYMATEQYHLSLLALLNVSTSLDKVDHEGHDYEAPLRRRALRRRHCVGSGAPVNFGARRRPKYVFSKVPKKCPSILKISDGLLLVIDRILQQNKYTAKMASRRADKLSAAARRSTKVGGGANKL